MGTDRSLPGPLDFGMHYRLTLRILNHSIFLRVKLEDSYSVSARFRHNVVIIKPYCRLKIELSSFEIHNISLRNTGFFVCVWRSFLWLICCFSGDVFLIQFALMYQYFCTFLNDQRIAMRTQMKRALVFRVLGLSLRTSQKQPFFFRVTSIRLSAGRQDSRNY